MSDKDTTYNGWTNYETWAVSLWIDNTEYHHLHWREMAQTAWDQATGGKIFTRAEQARFSLAEQLKGWVEVLAPNLPPSMYSDLLNAAISEVDWQEIAENMLEDVSKSEEVSDSDTE